MGEERPKRETMSLEETTISNMWEIVTALNVPVAELLKSSKR
ncbi:MAG: hypothetical protein SGJ16_07975 [Nitrospirota bacterium]|nr:hypothetical protein [Nitrospirota bacterium]